MPLYEFYCETCGRFEQVVNSSTVKDTMHCPMCGNAKAKRIFAPPSHSGVFSGVRHKIRRRAEKGREPRVVRKKVGEPLKGTMPLPHAHDHGATKPGYPPWMIKH